MVNSEPLGTAWKERERCTEITHGFFWPISNWDIPANRCGIPRPENSTFEMIKLMSSKV
jgi:hypothetical protein